MALTSSSTLADAENQYLDNLDWEGDVTKATNCLEAVRYILLKRPFKMTSNGRNAEYESLQKEKEELMKFVNTNKTASRNRKAHFTRGRMLT